MAGQVNGTLAIANTLQEGEAGPQWATLDPSVSYTYVVAYAYSATDQGSCVLDSALTTFGPGAPGVHMGVHCSCTQAPHVGFARNPHEQCAGANEAGGMIQTRAVCC